MSGEKDTGAARERLKRVIGLRKRLKELIEEERADGVSSAWRRRRRGRVMRPGPARE